LIAWQLDGQNSLSWCRQNRHGFLVNQLLLNSLHNDEWLHHWVGKTELKRPVSAFPNKNLTALACNELLEVLLESCNLNNSVPFKYGCEWLADGLRREQATLVCFSKRASK
jgi:hypothetical protein